jgi:hypothetical protein
VTEDELLLVILRLACRSLCWKEFFNPSPLGFATALEVSKVCHIGSRWSQTVSREFLE